MGKYAPLAASLSRQKAPEIEMTFRDLERVVGRLLPKAATQSSWWDEAETGADDSPQTRAWQSAGFRPVVDLKSEHVRFERID